MLWFGDSWNAPICADVEHCATPVGASCLKCSKPIVAGDQGLMIPLLGERQASVEPWHLQCFLESLGIRPPSVDTQPSTTCPWCGMVSYNMNDIVNMYCGNCHRSYNE